MTTQPTRVPQHAYGLVSDGGSAAGARILMPVLAVRGAWFRLSHAWQIALDTSTDVTTLADVINADENDRQRVVRWCAERTDDRGGRRRIDPGVAADVVMGVDPSSLACPLAPLDRDVVCVGLNYLDHVQEGARPAGRGAEAPDAPVYFTKAASSVIGPNDAIDAHPQRTSKLDYEVELGIVIGRDARDLDAANALEHVFGFVVFNDVSARDLQAARKQWYLGKSLESTSPLGPWIVPRACVTDPQSLTMELSVNGVVRQRASTAAMIHPISTILQDLTAGHRLAAGAVVATGTPAGCGYAMDPPAFLKPGDVVEASIDGLGAQRNRVVG